MVCKIIIDIDFGQDDVVVIIFVLVSFEFEVLGLIIVVGNVFLVCMQENVCIICQIVGCGDVVVYVGCDWLLLCDLVMVEYVYGKIGFDGVLLFQFVVFFVFGYVVDFIIDMLCCEVLGMVMLVFIGLLMNIVIVFCKVFDIIVCVQEIVLMGGVYFEVGNIILVVEFNIYVDFEVVVEVFVVGVLLIVMLLDVIYKVLISCVWVEMMCESGFIGQVIVSWIDFFECYDCEKYGSFGVLLYDFCIIGWLIWFDLFKGKYINVVIEIKGEFI